MQTLQQKVAIVTGASSGIGRATALLFASEGAKVVLGARRQSELDGVVEEIEALGGEAIAVVGDVREEAHAKALVNAAIGRFGGLDIAFNNAGTIGRMAPTSELTRDDWTQVIETNLTGAFLGARHQVPALLERGGGTLIFTSSFVGYTASIPGLSAYAASKAGLIGLAKTLAVEHGAQGLRANAILPGGADTPANMVNAPDATQEVRDFVEGLHALKRIASPEEIARAVLFLASEASSFVSGSAMLVDGGLSINRT
ncbi:SDR family oxidoreductase [Halomonas elongata]|uniref:Glucose 1-dehydrogenase 1 n=1 Tax=Halomonas elongata TaxID=2746 RepID=A0A1B8P6K6_HALEL|nr:SDR family oxidoreductase [Halomonas elongata]OBX37904.1 glucose 1-dehydrogenase 1 [Halomonas elongata]WVI72104.1 SDR family oxidoreductase [Halomonas elongata]